MKKRNFKQILAGVVSLSMAMSAFGFVSNNGSLKDNMTVVQAADGSSGSAPAGLNYDEAKCTEHDGAPHFYSLGVTYNSGGLSNCVKGILYQLGVAEIKNEQSNGAILKRQFENESIEEGWYYYSGGVFVPCNGSHVGSSNVSTNKYTLSIPSEATASGAGFNAFAEKLSITGAAMADTKEIVITAEGSEFKCKDPSIKTTIGYEVAVDDGNGGGKSIAENGLIVSAADANANEGYSKTVGLIVDEASFDNADDGEYTTTIKWTAKVRTAATTN